VSPVAVRRIQAVVATMGDSGSNSRRCMACAGVIQPSVLRGRSLSSVATSRSRSGECSERSVPLGKYWRSKPFDAPMFVKQREFVPAVLNWLGCVLPIRCGGIACERLRV